MVLCGKDYVTNASTISEIVTESMIVVFTLYALCCVVAIVSMVIVLYKRGQKQQPRFVILQMFFVVGFLLCMGFYFIYMAIAHSSGEEAFNKAFFYSNWYWPNVIAILGALSIQISDWLFTE